jgi:hypothetical protein
MAPAWSAENRDHIGRVHLITLCQQAVNASFVAPPAMSHWIITFPIGQRQPNMLGVQPYSAAELNNGGACVHTLADGGADQEDGAITLVCAAGCQEAG